MIKVISAVFKKGDKSFSLTLQPDANDHWFAAVACEDPDDTDWIDDFLGGERPSFDVTEIKQHIEKRVEETGVQWDGWKHYHDYELPGQPGAN
jgi:hypothetical protein